MTKLDDIIERPRRHWTEDGVLELTMGVQWFLTGAIFWFGQTIQHGSSFAKVYAFAQSVLWASVSLGGMWGLKRLKERVIAPRAGYVALPDPRVKVRITAKGTEFSVPSRRVLISLIALLGSLGVLVMLGRWGVWMENPRRWTWMIGPAFAFLAAIYMVWAARRFQARRYFWLAALSLVLAVWMYWTRAPFERISVILTWLGGGMALMGALGLRAFLKANPGTEQSGE